MEQLAWVLKVLSDPNRVRIVNILSMACASVCDLQMILHLSQTSVSKHLAFLRKVSLVRDQREGPRVLYALRRANPYYLAVSRFVRACVTHSAQMQKDLERLEDCKDAGRLAMTPRGPLAVEDPDENQNVAV